MRPSMAARAPAISAGSRPRSAGSRNCTAATMLSSVSPVITGAEAASPHPTRASSVSIRTRTLSARRTSSPAMMTGLSIGRLTAIASIDFIFTTILNFRNSGRIDDVLEHRDFLGDARPAGVGALQYRQETRLIQLIFHAWAVERLERFRFQPLDGFGRSLGRRQQAAVGREHEALVTRLFHSRDIRQIRPAGRRRHREAF